MPICSRASGPQRSGTRWNRRQPGSTHGTTTIHADGGRDVPLRTRRERVDAEVRRLTELGATAVRVLQQDDLDHYAVAMTDPEGNEFDVN
jgi:hypothetical protein